MLGHVGHPHLVGRDAAEDAVDEIIGGRQPGDAATFRRSGAVLDLGSLHQHRDRAVANPDAAAEHELGVHPVRAVGVVGGSVDLARSANQAYWTARATAAGTATHGSSHARLRARGSRPRPAAPRPPSPRWPRTAGSSPRSISPVAATSRSTGRSPRTAVRPHEPATRRNQIQRLPTRLLRIPLPAQAARVQNRAPRNRG